MRRGSGITRPRSEEETISSAVQDRTANVEDDVRLLRSFGLTVDYRRVGGGFFSFGYQRWEVTITGSPVAIERGRAKRPHMFRRAFESNPVLSVREVADRQHDRINRFVDGT